MLSKLYKHEFRASSRYYVPVFLASGLISLVLAIVWTINNTWKNEIFSTITSPFVFLLFFGALAAITAVSFFIPIFRFYKTMISDEGYLTHTLPVTTDQLILSRMLVAITYKVFCFILTLVIIALTIVLTIIVTKTYETNEWNIMVQAMHELLDALGAYQVSIPLLVVETVVMSVEGLFSSVLVCYVAMAIAQCMKNHKVIWSVVFYICVNIAVSMISNVISTITMMGYGSGYMMNNEVATFKVFQVSFLIAIILDVLVIVAGYFITRYIFQKRLNLE